MHAVRRSGAADKGIKERLHVLQAFSSSNVQMHADS